MWSVLTVLMLGLPFMASQELPLPTTNTVQDCPLREQNFVEIQFKDGSVLFVVDAVFVYNNTTYIVLQVADGDDYMLCKWIDGALHPVTDNKEIEDAVKYFSTLKSVKEP